MAGAILVIGSTGKQGGALIEALLSASDSLDSPILAVTRNTKSPGAKALLAKSPRIKLVRGDLSDGAAIFKAAETKVKSVFYVPIPTVGPGEKPELEEVQGKKFVDAALQNGVEHFVFTSVDRNSDATGLLDTDVPQFMTKAKIERYLQEKAGTSMTWTILRPVAFMDNIDTGFVGKMFPTVRHKSSIPICWPLILVNHADFTSSGMESQYNTHQEDATHRSRGYWMVRSSSNTSTERVRRKKHQSSCR